MTTTTAREEAGMVIRQGVATMQMMIRLHQDGAMIHLHDGAMMSTMIRLHGEATVITMIRPYLKEDHQALTNAL
jgi:hypothetical protein